jgi:hypothetical protein
MAAARGSSRIDVSSVSVCGSGHALGSKVIQVIDNRSTLPSESALAVTII